MKVPRWLHRRLLTWAERAMNHHPADFIIPRDETWEGYLCRWWIMRNARWLLGRPKRGYTDSSTSTGFNIYLHKVMRSDFGPTHDHPWWSFSILLSGRIGEDYRLADGTLAYREFQTRQIVFRSSTFSHTLKVREGDTALTLFCTGPRVRQWGFWCPNGWRTAPDYHAGGCGERNA